VQKAMFPLVPILLFHNVEKTTGRWGPIRPYKLPSGIQPTLQRTQTQIKGSGSDT
jgi:hypothetical protein